MNLTPRSAHLRRRTGQLFLAALAILAFSSSVHAKSGEVAVSAQFGYIFANPTSLNSTIDYYNSAYGLIASQLGTAIRLSGAVTYQISEKWAVGVSYARSSPWVSSSFGSLTGKLQAFTNLIGVRPVYYFRQSDGWDFFFSPTVGVGLYSVETNFGTGGTIRTSSSNTAAWGAASLGIKKYLDGTFGLSLEGGYQYAVSGALKVDSQAGSTFSPGDTLVLPGAGSVTVNYSGPFVCAGIELKF
jgi:hypothetical protein